MYVTIYSADKMICAQLKSDHSTVQYSKVQYSPVQYSTVHYSTVQYSTYSYFCVRHNAGITEENLLCQVEKAIKGRVHEQRVALI